MRLRPLREDELDDWVSRSREGYAREMIEHGGFPEAEAREKAREDFATHLRTARHGVFALEDDSSGERIGDLWVAELRGALAAVAVVLLHRANIARLRAGTERRFRFGREAPAR